MTADMIQMVTLKNDRWTSRYEVKQTYKSELGAHYTVTSVRTGMVLGYLVHAYGFISSSWYARCDASRMLTHIGDDLNITEAVLALAIL